MQGIYCVLCGESTESAQEDQALRICPGCKSLTVVIEDTWADVKIQVFKANPKPRLHLVK